LSGWFKLFKEEVEVVRHETEAGEVEGSGGGCFYKVPNLVGRFGFVLTSED